MPKNISILYDGTWNTPDKNPEVDGDSSTNVWKLYEALAAVDENGTPQAKWYQTGVGTKWYNKLRGGTFGVGLSKKIQEGYRQLAELYETGDRIYIFGFSRGAYSARSLVGLIRNAGLLKKAHLNRVSEAYALYRTRDEGPDSENARFFRDHYAQEVDIHFLGVWDTVGALGVPIESFRWFNKDYYQFHDTELSVIVKNAFHAIAIDEHRKNYRCTLWDPKVKPNQKVEQAWFSGAHANVGGGYADNRLSDIPLRWIMDQAKHCGLALEPDRIPAQPEDLPPVMDSYKAFLGGTYSLFETRYFRTIGGTPNGQESISDTVIQRTREDPRYRPKNAVLEHLKGPLIPVGRISADSLTPNT